MTLYASFNYAQGGDQEKLVYFYKKNERQYY